MRLQGVGLTWSAGRRKVLDGVGLDAPSGGTVGLLGPNGSGKSSLMRLLAGVRRPDAGQVSLDGRDVATLSRAELARRLALVEQDVATDLDPLVRDVVDLGRIPHRRSWAPESSHDHEVVARAAATTRVGHLLDRRYGTLSGGERQRVQLARALAQEPEVLLLDEPTNHLDIRHQLDFLQLVRGAEATVVMALHDLNFAASFCDAVVVLDAGRVVASGPPADVLDEALIGRVYGVTARVARDEDGLHVRFLSEG
ncbi:MAG: ABC transporter ATP-binding protein [Aeromicrobium sp.]|uniref:ABC transporter ATP-binding protein n=1 Tax=Aeromicrobium sp. TaxID=1871063 RepID=UPI0039E28794